MRAVGRLLLTYFTGSRASRWLTMTGLLLMLASTFVALYLPQNEHMLAFAAPGVIAFFLGTWLMPLTLGGLARGHAARLLPGGRIKLLASAVLTVLVVALPPGLLTPLAYVAGMSTNAQELLRHRILLDYALWLAAFTYTSACIAAGWIYVLMWFVTSERGSAGFGKAMVVLLVLMFLPLAPDLAPQARLQSNLWQLAVMLTVFGAGFLAWPRLARWRAGFSRASHTASGTPTRDLGGREVDLLLGNSRPWTLVAVLLLLLVIAIRTDSGGPLLWLGFLSVASVIAGGNAERAPARSRGLWLRADWSRERLFGVVERSAWRHNGMVLLALLACLAGVARLAAMSPAQLASGAALILLGAALSTYLGLSLTRGFRLSEGLIAASVMTVMLGLAVIAARGPEGVGMPTAGILAGGFGVLAATAAGLRWLARRRWARIDWSAARRGSQPALRAG